MSKIKNWFTSKWFWLKTGHGLEIVNDGNPVDEVVIKYKDFYFSVFIDAESGEPTGNFSWSKDPTVFMTPIREIWTATAPLKQDRKK